MRFESIVLIVLASLTLAGCDREKEGGEAEAALRHFRLGLDDLKKDLSEKGEVTRQSRVDHPTGPVPDVTITRTLEKRLYNDPDVPALLIAVSTAGAHVTLTGRVGSVEQLQKAMLLSLMSPGVQGVTAKLTIEPDDGSGATKGGAASDDTNEKAGAARKFQTTAPQRIPEVRRP